MPLAHELLAWLRAPGWRGHLLALIAGALPTLSFTPFDFWPLGLLWAGVATFGGFAGARRAWRLPVRVVRAIVIVTGLVMSALFFGRGG